MSMNATLSRHFVLTPLSHCPSIWPSAQCRASMSCMTLQRNSNQLLGLEPRCYGHVGERLAFSILEGHQMQSRNQAISFPCFCWPSLCPASARFAVVTMPKPLKKNSSQPMAKCARSKGKRTDACLQVKGKAGKSTDRQAARIRAAAQALLANVGRGGISRLVEDTGVELNEKGIRTRVTNRHQQPSAQHDSMQAMEVAQHQQHSAASPLPAFSPQHPNTPVTAIKQKQDINSLLSGWSLKTPPKDCQEAPPAAAGQ